MRFTAKYLQPQFPTLKYFADRCYIVEISNLLMAEAIRKFKPAATEAAIDSTGMEVSAAAYASNPEAENPGRNTQNSRSVFWSVPCYRPE